MICQVVIYVIKTNAGQGNKKCGEQMLPFKIGWVGMAHLKGDI